MRLEARSGSLCSIMSDEIASSPGGPEQMKEADVVNFCYGISIVILQSLHAETFSKIEAVLATVAADICKEVADE